MNATDDTTILVEDPGDRPRLLWSYACWLHLHEQWRAAAEAWKAVIDAWPQGAKADLIVFWTVLVQATEKAKAERR